jgi:hypothetical protein
MVNNNPVESLFKNETPPPTTPPNMGYFDTNKINTPNSASTLKSLLQSNCQINSSDTLGGDKYYNDTITGNINESCGVNSVTSEASGLTDDVSNACTSGQSKIVNQIKYMACQLAMARNRSYNSSDFDILNGGMTVKEVFDRFSNIKIVMYLIFGLSIYFLIQGICSSFDVIINMMNLVEENSNKNLTYSLGLGLGIALPVLLLSIFFVDKVCGNIKAIEKWNITNSISGGTSKDKINSGFVNLDYSVLVIFIFLLYGLTAILFFVKKDSLSSTAYMMIVFAIFLVISIFLYVLYYFVPFFATANINNTGKSDIPLKLYINDDGRDEAGNISSNQTQLKNLQEVFMKTAVVFFLFFVIYIIFSKKIKEKGTLKDLFSGFFGASAILIIPILLVINFILATKYFYFYPILLLMFRFVRYIGMAILYGQYSYAQEYGLEGMFSGDGFSNDLRDQLDDFGSYSPSWNLIGVDIVKSLMNINGYENLFSKNYKNENKSNNLASNKYVIPGLFSYFGKDPDQDESLTRNKLIIQGSIASTTIVISVILLKLIYKVD